MCPYVFLRSLFHYMTLACKFLLTVEVKPMKKRKNSNGGWGELKLYLWGITCNILNHKKYILGFRITWKGINVTSFHYFLFTPNSSCLLVIMELEEVLEWDPLWTTHAACKKQQSPLFLDIDPEFAWRSWPELCGHRRDNAALYFQVLARIYCGRSAFFM